MKKIINFILIGVLLAAASCTDLDLQPQSTTTSDVLFKDESAYRSFLAKVYAAIAVTGQQGPAGNSDITSLDEGFSNYLRQWWQLEELSTDEAVIAWGDEGIRDLHTQTWTTANQFNRAIYYRIFFLVSQANEFLKETTDEKLDSRGVSEATHEAIHSYRAEARFLRALAYWHGIDLYGSIPYYTEEFTIGSDAPEQASRVDVFNFIESELKEIESELPAPGQNEYGRADQAALWVLQAKLYLNAKVYTNTDRSTDCITACKKVIDSGVYSLEENYRYNFTADNHLSKEIIFSIPFDGLSTQTWGGTTYLVHAALGGKMVDNLDDATGEEYPNKDEATQIYGVNSGWFGLRTTSTFVDLFPDISGDSDERAIFYTDGQSKEISENGIPNFTEGYAMPKFSNLTRDGQAGPDLNHPDTDFPMFRLADVYLMYAEAVLNNGSGGDLGTALGYINKLRERAYNGTSGNINQGDLTLDFILDERGRELYWEGHRRTDLIRFNQFSENGVWPHKGGVAAGKTTEPFRNLYPIPASEILANPNLTQNPGYF